MAIPEAQESSGPDALTPWSILTIVVSNGVLHLGDYVDGCPGADGSFTTGLNNYELLPVIVLPIFEIVCECPWCGLVSLDGSESVKTCRGCSNPYAVLYVQMSSWLRVYPYLRDDKKDLRGGDYYAQLVENWDILVDQISDLLNPNDRTSL